MGIIASRLSNLVHLSFPLFLRSGWELGRQAVKMLWRDSPTPEKLPENGNDGMLESVLMTSG